MRIWLLSFGLVGSAAISPPLLLPPLQQLESTTSRPPLAASSTASGAANPCPDETRVWLFVVDLLRSTWMMAPLLLPLGLLLVSATNTLPSAASARPTGVSKLWPNETMVWLLSIGLVGSIRTSTFN